MSAHTAENLAELTPSHCVKLLIQHRLKWLLPMAACAVLALGYALVMPRYWEATQGFIVRPEVSGSANSKLGKFEDLYKMRTFQETILELVKSQQVVVATWKAIEQTDAEPTPAQLDSLRERLTLLPPGGAEFGKTEVCYLQVKDQDRDRALRLVTEFGRQVDHRLQRLRTQQSQSLSDELQQQVDLAKTALEAETAQLAEFESQVGPDLGELRMLNASFSGQSDLRQQAVQLKDEHRTAEILVQQSQQLLKVLQKALQEPARIIAMPNSLLVSQPTLRQLKDGLVDAQLRAARLEGTRTAKHPQVQAAKQSVEYIRRDLHKELQVAIEGVQIELQLENARLSQLNQQYQQVQQRLARLAELRAGYANHTVAVENSRKVLDLAQQQLGEVSAALAAAESAQLVTPIDQAETGPYPAGPGRATIVLVGTFGGFALGMGMLFLTVSPLPVNNEPQVVFAPVEPKVDETLSTETEQPLNTPAVPRAVPSNLPPAVAAKIAEIVAAREPAVSVEPHL